MQHPDFFKRIEDAAFFQGLNPELTIGAEASASIEAGDDGGAGWPERLGRQGYCEAARVVAASRAAQLTQAITNLEERGVPAVFAFVYDAFWEPIGRLAPGVEAAIGPFDVLDDVWAWRVRAGGAGWPPHRGRSIAERSPAGLPVTLNVWIALTDVTADDACIHLVPLDEDPSHPDHLERLDVPTGAARALPVAAGTALLWDANVLHWGGRCVGPARQRVSISFTLRALAAPRIPGTSPVDLSASSFRARLDLVASQIVTYADREPSFSPAALEWAQATVALLELGARSARRCA